MSTPAVTLSSGRKIPMYGFGTANVLPSEAADAVKTALSVGYRHFDCAALYMNESEIGSVLCSSGVDREELFVTSKVWNTCHARDKVVDACRQSIANLKCEYLDLYLVHHPFSWEFGGLPIGEDNWVARDDDGGIKWGAGVSLMDTWRGMEDCVRLGLVKDIGISNYPAMAIADVMQYAQIPPVVNQCEGHVNHARTELRQVCDLFGVHFTMYSILGRGKVGPLSDPVVVEVAKEAGATPAQCLIAWGVQSGCSVLAKSANADRIRENFHARDIVLSESAMKRLNALDKGLICCNTVEYWGFPGHA